MANTHPLTFIFAGPAGSGKGTQVALLKKRLMDAHPEDKLFHFYTGDGFRDFIRSDSYSAERARKIQAGGGLQPEFLAVWLWASAFIGNMRGGEHLIIDGSPRKLVEAEALDSAMKFYGREKPFVVALAIPDAEAVRRLLVRARDDDNEAAIRERLSWHKTNVVPAIDFFRRRPAEYRVLDINSDQPIEKVHADIAAAVGL